MAYRLLETFQATFRGKRYIHRDSSRGDFVAIHLYEDLYTVGKSKLYLRRVEEKERILNIQNRRRGIAARRGDATFGELIHGQQAIEESGFQVAREATEAEVRLVAQAKPSFDEFLILRYRATNAEPYDFEWVDLPATVLDYGAILTRISREYDRRFRNNGLAAV